MDAQDAIKKAAEGIVRIERKYYFEKVGSKTPRRKEVKEYIDRVSKDYIHVSNGDRNDEH